MRHSKHIIGSLVIVATAVWCLHEWTFLSDGPAYFAADWRRAGLVAALGIAGGLTVFGFMQFPDGLRRRLAAIIFGTGAVLAVIGCVYSLWQLFRLREFLAEARILWIATAVEFGMCSLVGGLCAWLWRHYRKRDEKHAG